MSAETPKSSPVEVFITYFVMNLGLWLALTFSLDPQELIVGAAVAAIAAWVGVLVSKEGRPLMEGSVLYPMRALRLVYYTLYLMWQIVLSNWDVARRVISPRLPIDPGIVKVRTSLKTPLGRLILANSITLTPGTLTVDIEDDLLCIHWIDVQSEDIEAATSAIVGNFERHLEVIFG